jgi:hypothetical protein
MATAVSDLLTMSQAQLDDEITVVRGHTIAEADVANGLPVSNGLSLTFWEENKP